MQVPMRMDVMLMQRDIANNQALMDLINSGKSFKEVREQFGTPKEDSEPEDVGDIGSSVGRKTSAKKTQGEEFVVK